MRMLSFLLICVVLGARPAQSQAVVEHFVGSTGGPGIRDGVGPEARFFHPSGVWADSTNVYVADGGNRTIRKIAIASGAVTTLAGKVQQYSVVDGDRESARFGGPSGLWSDGIFLYVIDSGFIRKVDPSTGQVSLFADKPVYTGPIGGPIVLPQPYAITGNSTNLFVLDSQVLIGSSFRPTGTASIRQISLSSGQVQTLPFPRPDASGAYDVPRSLWADDRFLYLSYVSRPGEIVLGRMDLTTYDFTMLTGFTPPTSRTPYDFYFPQHLWSDGAGNFFFTDQDTIYQFVLTTGQVVAVAKTPSASLNNIAGIWGAGHFLFASDASAHTVFKVDLSTKEAKTLAGMPDTSILASSIPPSTLQGVRGIWSDGAYVYAADQALRMIHKIDIVSGRDSAFVSNINSPIAVWGDAAYLYVLQPSDNRLIKVSLATGQAALLAQGFEGTAITGDADYLYVATGVVILRVSKTNGEVITFAGRGVPGNADGVGTGASFNTIYGLWTDGTTIYLAESTVVRSVVIRTQQVGTVAGLPGTLSDEDGVATNAHFYLINSITGDNDYLYVGESSGSVRRISRATAEVSTIIGQRNIRVFNVTGLWTNGQSLYVADGRLKRLDLSSLAVTTIAGPSIVLSQGTFPSNNFSAQTLTGDSNYLYAMDGCALYKVSLRTRDITALAGTFNECGSGDGRGNQARFNVVASVLFSDAQYVYVAEYVDPVIRRVDASTGDVVTIATGQSIRLGWSDGKYLYGLNYNASIYRMDLVSGQTSLFAGGLGILSGIWGDGTYLYVTEYSGCGIGRINLSTAERSFVAGKAHTCSSNPIPVDGTASDTVFSNLKAITGDGRLLYVLDGFTVRSVDPNTGETHTIAGSYAISGTEDGAGSEAHFMGSSGPVMWSDGASIYIADGAIRRVILPRPASAVQFNLGATGGDYWKTSLAADPLQIGYGRVHTTVGVVGPDAVATFSYRHNGVLISEASVPASAPVQTGRIYVEVGGNVNTGLAIANPNSQPANISFYFTDVSGVNFGAGTATMAANSQISAFLSETPFRPAAAGDALSRARSFTFTSSIPVGAIALRGYTNERSDFLMTTLPVTPISSPSTDSILLPHFADGGGWQTRLLLVNPTDSVLQGTVSMNSTINYSIAPRSSIDITTPGTSPAVRTGAVRITPVPGSYSPVASTVFSFRQSGVVVTESGIAAVGNSRFFRLFAETGTVRTGLAVANAGSAAGTVQFELLSLAGTHIASSTPIQVQAGGRLSLFVDEIPGFDGIPGEFRGVLRVSADVPLTVAGLRSQKNERGEFLIAATPALSDTSQASLSDLIFPHIVTGDGYVTEFLLLSGSAVTQGRVDFMSQSGAAAQLSILH